MSNTQTNPADDPFGVLKRFVSRKRAGEACELCSQELGPEHSHLLELGTRKLVCSCEGCALLFSSQSHARYRKVPRRIWALQDFHLSDAEWDAMLIPIDMAFISRNSLNGSLSALYPSPAGATESLLRLESWNEIVGNNPVLREMETDTEAILVNRVAHSRGAAPAEYYLLPIDECYRLTGIIRRGWRGFSGGSEVWREIAGFFDELKRKSTVVPRATYA